MKKIEIVTFVVLSLLFVSQHSADGKSNNFAANRIDFIQGVDLSALMEVEENGGVFIEKHVPKDVLLLFKTHGINFVRLRIWHTPVSGYNNLEKTLQMAGRVKAAGLKLLLDFHYSDTWADPGHQLKPVAWENLPYESLKDSVYQYTSRVITALAKNGTPPAMVQVGNEITCGILWDDGRICDFLDTQAQWSRLAGLLKSGIRGVRQASCCEDSIDIMIHIDRGGDNAGSRWFFDHLLKQQVDFDVIGLSYYPWWHGTLKDLSSNVNDLATRYGKKIIVAETASPWTLDWFDDTHNIVGDPGQLLPGYPASVEGQKQFIIRLADILKNIPEKKGMAFFYWAQDWISTPQKGSPWENMTLFDFSGELINSISAFDSILSGISLSEKSWNFSSLLPNIPNPFNSSTKIRYQLEQRSQIVLKIYNLQGQEVKTLINSFQESGDHSIIWDGSREDGKYVSSGIYVAFFIAGKKREFRKMVLIK